MSNITTTLDGNNQKVYIEGKYIGYIEQNKSRNLRAVKCNWSFVTQPFGQCKIHSISDSTKKRLLQRIEAQCDKLRSESGKLPF